MLVDAWLSLPAADPARASPFLQVLLDEGLVGLLASNSSQSMGAFGSDRANLGNNPIGFCAPSAEGSPDLCVDFCCAVISFGRKALLEAAGSVVPPGAFFQSEGEKAEGAVSSDKEQAEKDAAGEKPTYARPFGAYKGASIAVIAEVLAALVGGGHAGSDVETITSLPDWMDADGKTLHEGEKTFSGNSQFVLAIDPDAFAPNFATRLTTYLDAIGTRLPGGGAEARKERAAAGIPLPTALAEEIASLGEAKGIAVDFAALADTEKEQEDDQTPPAKPFLGGLGAVLPPLLLLGGLYLMRVRAENR